MFDFSPNPSADRVSWDGLFNGAVVQSGVYIYAADIVQADGTKAKIAGDLTIIR